MIRYIVLVILMVSAGVFAIGWETVITVDGGNSREMKIGMVPGASEGYDRDIDLAAPPIPPVGFYSYFPVEDTSFEFLNAAWTDMRAPGPSAEWQIRIVRPTQPTRVVFSGLPMIGKLSINNIDAVEESLALTFSQADTVLRIKYDRGFWEEPSATIDFETTFDAEAIIVITDSEGRSVRRLPDMFLKAGEHSIGWNARSNRSYEVEPGLYTARVSLKADEDFSDFEVDVVVRSNENSTE